MRVFFISPKQKISSLHNGSETVSESKFSPNVLHFEEFRVILFVFSLHLRSSSCQLGKCTRKLLLIPLIAMKSSNALELPFGLGSASIPVLFILAPKSITVYLFH